MSSAIVFYVSGHGFGHASRVIEVINAILARRPETRIGVRTAAQWGPAIYQPAITHQVVGPDAAALLTAQATAYRQLRAAAHYEVQTLPTCVLIDPAGRLLGRAQGVLDWSRPEVGTLLAESPRRAAP